jgi:hypothetical protein
MTSTLEYLGKPAVLSKDFALVLMLDGITGHVAPVGSSIDLCAWCDLSKAITNELERIGYKTSHGICAKHEAEVLKEYYDTTRTN